VSFETTLLVTDVSTAFTNVFMIYFLCVCVNYMVLVKKFNRLPLDKYYGYIALFLIH
jgi:hypothetical protein